MSTRYYRTSLQRPWWIFDLSDGFAQRYGVRGAHPALLGKVHIYVKGTVSNGTVAPWPHPLQAVTAANGAGQLIFFGRIKLADGALRSRYLQEEQTYLLRLESHSYQIIERPLPFAPHPANPPPASSDYTVLAHPDPADTSPHSLLVTLDLEPGYAYPFPRTSNYRPTLLRGHVQTADKQGVPDVRVSVAAQGISYELTDKTGQFVLVFPDDQPAGDITVEFVRNGANLAQRIVPLVPGQTNSMDGPVEVNV